MTPFVGRDRRRIPPAVRRRPRSACTRPQQASCAAQRCPRDDRARPSRLPRPRDQRRASARVDQTRPPGRGRRSRAPSSSSQEPDSVLAAHHRRALEQRGSGACRSLGERTVKGTTIDVRPLSLGLAGRTSSARLAIAPHAAVPERRRGDGAGDVFEPQSTQQRAARRREGLPDARLVVARAFLGRWS